MSFLIFENGAFEMMAVLKRWALLVGLIAVAGCTGLPEDIEQVTGFESDRVQQGLSLVPLT
ncbi:hypothetical protein MSSD14B_29900 [Marinobacter salsuginis]|uniref:Uncharacterized protein n=1 Tax=Marinobacter salsuginis TaxID=418719 RepID=A0A5M3Q2F5_9GAMM|nr:hypothetical protein MSSD14B_29900 [Marinobacter salsuginis]